MPLAIFDLDNTLIAGDSDHLWGRYLCRRGLVNSENFSRENDRFLAEYERGELDIEAYLRFALGPLAGRPMAEVSPWRDEFMRDWIAPLMLPAAEALLQRHRDAGDRLLIITATNEFVTRPIASALGVEELLGCALEIEGGVITGRGRGIPTYREGKVQRLREWLAAEGESLSAACFYSDSHNDLPLLEVVDHPVAVDPDARLAAVARERGWPVISLRGDGALKDAAGEKH